MWTLENGVGHAEKELKKHIKIYLYFSKINLASRHKTDADSEKINTYLARSVLGVVQQRQQDFNLNIK